MLEDQLDCTVEQEYGDSKSVLFQQEEAASEVAMSPPVDLFKDSHSNSLGQLRSIGLALHVPLLGGSAAE